MTTLDAVSRAWLECETSLANLLGNHGDWKSLPLSNETIEKRQQTVTCLHYDELHQNDNGYKSNNWLVDDVSVFVENANGTIVELGCGNGRFAEIISNNNISIIGIDWVASPELPKEAENFEFRKANILFADIPECDIVCSSDFLEHLNVSDLEEVFKKLKHSSLNQYHVIACYDDNHSHLTVMRPAAWLLLFRKFFPDAKLIEVLCRRNSSKLVVCKIVTGKIASIKHSNC